MKSAGQLTLWSEDSPASPTPSPAGAREKKMSATCGPSSHDWCATSDPLGCLLRTYLASALQQRTKSSVIWSKKATPLGRSWWVLTTLERHTDESASGSWPTATAGDADASGSRSGTPRASSSAKAHPGTSLTDAVNGLWHWPTPAATPYGSNGYPEDWKAGRPGKRRPSLEGLAREEWATPRSSDWRSGNVGDRVFGKNSRPLCEQATRLEVEAGQQGPDGNSTGGNSNGSLETQRGILNPAWVGQLMGAPDGWLAATPPKDVLASAPGETALSRRTSKRSRRPSILS